MSTFRIAVFAFAFALSMATGHRASAQAVDLQLVLAVDTSGSVSEERFDLQKQGYVAAFRSQRLLQAIGSGTTRAIAATMVQWTGPVLQVQVVPWMLIDNEASMHAFADAINRAPRQLFGGGTSISGAIDYAMTLFPRTEFQGGRRVIDISGDGANNRGRPAISARDDAVRAGASINGLPILALEPSLDRYYWDNVIGGPGAFVIAAESYETFADAVLKKLVIEIADIIGATSACRRASAPNPQAATHLERTRWDTRQLPKGAWPSSRARQAALALPPRSGLPCSE